MNISQAMQREREKERERELPVSGRCGNQHGSRYLNDVYPTHATVQTMNMPQASTYLLSCWPVPGQDTSIE